MTESPAPEHRPAPAQRASHDDREEVVEQLREAAGDGRIDLDELEERLERAYAAKTRAELEPLTADLRPADGSRDGEPLVLQAHLGDVRQTGYWTVPRRIGATSETGSIVIDFTEAVCRHREVALEVTVAMGSVEVVVPRGWSVSTHGTNVTLGMVKNRATRAPAPGSPALQVTGKVSMGSLKVRYPRRWKRQKPAPE